MTNEAQAISTETVTVYVYHRCAAGPSGLALGPRNAVTAWWATPGDHASGWRLRLVGDFAESGRPDVAAAIRHEIGPSPADLARAAQDAAAEGPDL